jgi:hypothetical protein
VSNFSPFVNFEASFDKEFDTGTKVDTGEGPNGI